MNTTKREGFARIKQVVDALKYKPGHHFEALQGEDGAIEIVLRMPPLPSVIDGEMIELVFRHRFHSMELAHLPDMSLVKLVRSTIIQAWEMHEADEWFTYHGQQVHNPHQ